MKKKLTIKEAIIKYRDKHDNYISCIFDDILLDDLSESGDIPMEIIDEELSIALYDGKIYEREYNSFYKFLIKNT